MFVSKKGQSIFDRIVTDLKKRANKSSNQHYLILGPRGIGKSHLMANLYYMIKETQSLNSHWIPLWFSEEEYSVISLRDLADRILEEISGELPGENNKAINEIEAFKNAMALNSDDDEVFKLTSAFIKDLSNRLKKRFVIIFENFNMFLKDISSFEEKKLRSLLMNETFFLFIVSAPTLHSYLKEVADPQNALYNLFDVDYLSELSFEECQELIKQQCLSDNNPELLNLMQKDENKLRVFQRLAGGNPRLMLMFYQLTASMKSLPEIEDTFAELLEKLTPYFQSRTDSLSAQQRKILIAFTQSMENLTPAEIGKKVHLPTNQVTAQIKKLVEHGFLQIVDKEGQMRGTLYELAERIYRYWYQARTSKGRQWVAGLVEFLSHWFSMTELKQFEIEWEEKFEVSCDDNEKKSAIKRLDYINQSMQIKEDKYKQCTCNAIQLHNSGKFNDALHWADNAIEIIPRAEAYYNKGILLMRLGQSDPAIECFDKAIQLKPDFSHAYINIGAGLILLKKYKNAIKVYDKLIEFSPDLSPAYFNKAYALRKLGKQKEAIECYNKCIELEPLNVWGYFMNSFSKLESNAEIEALVYFQKGLDLSWKNELKNDKGSLISFFYNLLQENEYKFADTCGAIIEEKIEISESEIEGKIKNSETEYSKTILESFKNIKILIKFLKTNDKNLLDRQPLEIRQTLKEMAEYFSQGYQRGELPKRLASQKTINSPSKQPKWINVRNQAKKFSHKKPQKSKMK
jgi:tetratricopeptide (TPR) repeat protein